MNTITLAEARKLVDCNIYAESQFVYIVEDNGQVVFTTSDKVKHTDKKVYRAYTAEELFAMLPYVLHYGIKRDSYYLYIQKQRMTFNVTYSMNVYPYERLQEINFTGGLREVLVKALIALEDKKI